MRRGDDYLKVCLAAWAVVPITMRKTSRDEHKAPCGDIVDTIAKADCHGTLGKEVQLVTMVVVKTRTASSLANMTGEDNSALEIGQDLGAILGESSVYRLILVARANILHVPAKLDCIWGLLPLANKLSAIIAAIRQPLDGMNMVSLRCVVSEIDARVVIQLNK